MNTGSTSGGDDETVAEPFDQTNGMISGDDGESDGTAASDTASAAERDDDGEAGALQQDGGQGGLDAGLIIGRQQ
jgi:hypothetical protein